MPGAEGNNQGKGQEHTQHKGGKGGQENRNLGKGIKTKRNIATVFQVKTDKGEEHQR
jgi:hypothetical protein